MIHHRTQYPVGQGFFHAGQLGSRRENEFKLTDNLPKDFTYVYDCGALTKYTSALNDAIADYSARGPKKDIDILFVSHAHADHISGIPKLLTSRTAKAVIMPFVDVEERLIGYASMTGKVPVFIRNFFIDPVLALANLGIRLLIFLQSGRRDDNPDRPRLPESSDFPWMIRARELDKNHAEGKITVVTVAAGLTVEVPNKDGAFWVLDPYVSPMIKSKRDAFIAKLADLLAISKKELRNKLRNTDQLTEILEKHRAKLQEAYKSISENSDINLTSLSLYSGPIEVDHDIYSQVLWQGRPWSASIDNVAWLGTGDANLKHNADLNPFIDHYQHRLETVALATLTMPHHGSEGSFQSALLTRTNPEFCITSADAVKGWRHPGTEITRAIASHNAYGHVVTSTRSSVFIEDFLFK
jgi:hypothetical protein